MLWRRIDTPGHDACRLEQNSAGWSVEGAAVFRHPSGPACIAYSVQCDHQWRTMSGWVRGVLGQRPIEYRVAHRGATWTLNETPVPGLEALLDLDLGFTPATNLQQLRRVSIGQDEARGLPVAWLDVDAGALTELAQLYRRRGEAAFWYEAPSVGYQGLIELAPNGFIRNYPRLWEAEPPP